MKQFQKSLCILSLIIVAASLIIDFCNQTNQLLLNRSTSSAISYFVDSDDDSTDHFLTIPHSQVFQIPPLRLISYKKTTRLYSLQLRQISILIKHCVLRI
jgi:hypothetical protein